EKTAQFVSARCAPAQNSYANPLNHCGFLRNGKERVGRETAKWRALGRQRTVFSLDWNRLAAHFPSALLPFRCAFSDPATFGSKQRCFRYFVLGAPVLAVRRRGRTMAGRVWKRSKPASCRRLILCWAAPPARTSRAVR